MHGFQAVGRLMDMPRLRPVTPAQAGLQLSLEQEQQILQARRGALLYLEKAQERRLAAYAALQQEAQVIASVMASVESGTPHLCAAASCHICLQLDACL